MKNLFVQTTGILIVLLLHGCKTNYSFTGASIAPEVKTVSVQFLLMKQMSFSVLGLMKITGPMMLFYLIRVSLLSFLKKLHD